MHRSLTGQIVIATHNPAKLREIRELLARFGVEAVSAGDLGLPAPAETGHMFSENAAIKAHAAARSSGLASSRMIWACASMRSMERRACSAPIGPDPRTISAPQWRGSNASSPSGASDRTGAGRISCRRS